MEPDGTTTNWRARAAEWWMRFPRPARMIMAATGGITLLVAGAVMLVLPGPGLLVMAMGVALLATEFVWAQRVMTHGRRHATQVASKVKSAVKRPPRS